VIHGTNKAMIRRNVLFDLRAHAVLTEDGIETGNRFFNNIAARTNRAIRPLPFEKGFLGQESDSRFPSLFWFSNPENEVVGNVATGSADAGFWFEPVVKGPRKEQFEALQGGEGITQKVPTIFKDNVARANLVSEVNIGTFESHTMSQNGVRLYPTGLKATAEKRAIFLGNKAFRNRGTGLVTNRSFNIDIRGWYFADNGCT